MKSLPYQENYKSQMDPKLSTMKLGPILKLFDPIYLDMCDTMVVMAIDFCCFSNISVTAKTLNCPFFHGSDIFHHTFSKIRNHYNMKVIFVIFGYIGYHCCHGNRLILHILLTFQFINIIESKFQFSSTLFNMYLPQNRKVG